jgi:hypothetical protein
MSLKKMIFAAIFLAVAVPLVSAAAAAKSQYRNDYDGGYNNNGYNNDYKSDYKGGYNDYNSYSQPKYNDYNSKQYDSYNNYPSYDKGYNQYDKSYNQYDKSYNQYDKSYNQYEKSYNQYDKSYNQYDKSYNQYDKSYNQYDSSYAPSYNKQTYNNDYQYSCPPLASLNLFYPLARDNRVSYVGYGSTEIGFCGNKDASVVSVIFVKCGRKCVRLNERGAGLEEMLNFQCKQGNWVMLAGSYDFVAVGGYNITCADEKDIVPGCPTAATVPAVDDLAVCL